jgi:glycerol-3-phosphate acyltransferase PlsX
MRIAVDAMGGDYAPSVVVEGALMASKVLSKDDTLILIGLEDVVNSAFASLGGKPDNIQVVHASEVIGMDESPTKAVPQKKDSSIVKGFMLLATKEADVFCSAGNTGAMLVGAMFTIKPIEGVLRPGIAGFIPKESGNYGILMDVGANADCKPEVLVQFAEMASIFATDLYGIKNPKVGLINVGEEEQKGSLLTQATYQLLKQTDTINFVGNIEGRDIYSDKADVMICDGFTGNVILKSAEAVYPLMAKRGFTDDFVNMFDWQSVGGSPILGVNGNVVIGHGSSSSKAIKQMILLSQSIAKSEVSKKIKEAYKKASA